MIIGTIGDIHGKSVWKNIITNNPHVEKWVFVGDYVDDYPPTTDEKILGNLLDIIEFKKAFPDKVELLWGNHELSYTLDQVCSGYRPSMSVVLPTILKQNKNLFKYAFQIDNHVWTHAGILKGWYDDFKIFLQFLKEQRNIDLVDFNIADQINMLAQTSYAACLFDISTVRGGFQRNGGPLWADKSEFGFVGRNVLENYHQVVGHSKVSDPYKNEYNAVTQNGSVTFIDCLDTVTEFYEKEI